MDEKPLGAEEVRLQQAGTREANWQRWGPYLSERQWSTVREDYSPGGTAWTYLPHDHARSRAYRWGEDGLLGITDREGRLCFALALWNGKDPILKERLFGLTELEGNHGEDVKECYYYLDSTPTHSYMKALYKYPQQEFPYQHLIDENRKRGLQLPEYELLDTGVFKDNRYFDVFVEYAKASPNDLLIQITIHNRAKEEATVHLLPTLWFRNTWSWECSYEGKMEKPELKLFEEGVIAANHKTLGRFFFAYERVEDQVPTPLFTENQTNLEKLYRQKNLTPYVKDAFHNYVIKGDKSVVNPECNGTKFAPLYVVNIKGESSQTFRMRLYEEKESKDQPFGKDFAEVFDKRKEEAEQFYQQHIVTPVEEERAIAKAAFAGLLWTKQFYYYTVKEWLEGDPGEPPPPPERKKHALNQDWKHLYARDVISMPDKWEYPWFAAWDLAFHMIPFARIDPDFAKHQITLFLREWYMHPNGQQPAYEYSFSDVNPPVHAWSAWRVYKITGAKGQRDQRFLESTFQKLLLNFTWWVNRKDIEGNNLFGGGFLGLDNIGVFNRSMSIPTGGHLRQADGTAWMAFYCLTMLAIALELAIYNSAYEDLASKFFEHFVRITDAINQFGGTGLWDERDGFYYDQLSTRGQLFPLRTRSLVGLIPLIAVECLEESHISQLKGFSKRMEWFLNHREDLEGVSTYCKFRTDKGRRLLAIPSEERLRSLLRYLLDEKEFLSPYGIRSLSRAYEANPYVFTIGNHEYHVDYAPGEGTTYLFGGNSNWRGPIWLPLNFLIIEALERYHHFYGDDFKVECPIGSKKMLTLKEVARELSSRLASMFLPDLKGKRPCHGEEPLYQSDPYWKDLILFHEYFHAETGRGLGASHQTGWTALIAKLIQEKNI